MKLFGMTEAPTAHARYSVHTSDAVTLVCTHLVLYTAVGIEIFY